MRQGIAQAGIALAEIAPAEIKFHRSTDLANIDFLASNASASCSLPFASR